MTELDNPRSAYTAGLRALADKLDANPGIPAPVDGRLAAMTIYAAGEEEFTAAAHAFGCTWEPGWTQGSHGALYHLKGQVDGLRVQISTYADTPVSCDSTPELVA